MKTHGGKHYLASEIVARMPPHTHYVEPYFGGGSVLLAKNPEGVSEVVNDLDGDLINFWEVLREPELFDRFRMQVHCTSFCEASWRHARHEALLSGNVVTRAWAFFVMCRQSMAGRKDEFATLTRRRTRRGMNEQASAWLSAVEGLPEVHERLKRVVILNRPAIEVVRTQDGPDTLFYLDPPYMHRTRHKSSRETYGRYEMTDDDHVKLLLTIREARGKVMLSGYPSSLYDTLLLDPGWTRLEFDMPNHASCKRSKERKTECVWINFPNPDILPMYPEAA